MSDRSGYDFRGRQIPPSTRADWRHDARPTNYDGGRTAILARRIIRLLDALDEAEADLAQAWADGYNHAKVEMLPGPVEQDERRAEDAEAEVERLRSLLAKVQRVFDLQCPPMLPSKYDDRGAWMAHAWWDKVLGPVLQQVTACEWCAHAGRARERMPTRTWT